MNIQINRNSETPIYLQIKGAIKVMINSAELFPGYKMPSERKLAKELNVHRNTVVKVYSELIAEGYLVSSKQTPEGYFVTDLGKPKDFTTRFFPLGKRLRYNMNTKEKLFFNLYDSSYDKSKYITMGGLVGDKKLISLEGIENISLSRFQSAEEESNRLRNNIIKLLKQNNIYVNDKNIQFSSETNQLLNQISELFLSEGDCIIAEEPLMPDNMVLFRNKNLKVVTIPMEPDGMNLTILEKEVAKNHPKFIYTLPTYHNPTGITMSVEKRKQLLAIANKYDVPIIEEASQNLFNYTGNKIPSLYAMDQYHSVLYIDTFTLTFPYEIKVAYILGPYDFIEMLGRYVIITETTISALNHFILNEIIENDNYERVTREMVQCLKNRRDKLYAELQKISDKGISCTLPEGGLSIWCSLDENIKELQLTTMAQEKGLIIIPGSVFYPFGYQGCGHLRLAFSNCDEEELEKGVKILGECLDACRKENSVEA